MRVARLCPPAWWGPLPGSTLPWGTGPMQRSLIQDTIVKGLASCNGDDCKVLVALFADAFMRHNRAINALNAVGAPLGLGALEVLQFQQNHVGDKQWSMDFILTPLAITVQAQSAHNQSLQSSCCL